MLLLDHDLSTRSRLDRDLLGEAKLITVLAAYTCLLLYKRLYQVRLTELTAFSICPSDKELGMVS